MVKLELLQELPDFSLYFVDIWGVLYDGVKKTPVADKLLEVLTTKGRIILISNSSRTEHEVLSLLQQKEINTDLVDRIITSGSLIKNDIMSRLSHAGTHYFLIGTVGACVWLEDLKSMSSSSPERCEIAIAANHIFESDNELDEIIDRLLKNDIPVYSTNPDRFVNLNGNLQKAAGYFCARARKAGVKVIEYGKPNAEIFMKGLEAAGCSPEDACMIGDSLETDIVGAKNSGIKSILLEGGGGLTHTEQEILRACPDFIINVGH